MRYCRALSILALWLLACAASPAQAQQEDGSSVDTPTCTDLSGKFQVPCPGAHKDPTFEDGEASDDHAASSPSTAKKTLPGSAEEPAADPNPRLRPVRQPIGAVSKDADADPAFGAANGVPEMEPIVSDPSIRTSPERAVVRNLISDQKAIWTSPFRLRLYDVQWLAPLLGGTAVAIASDTSIQREIPTGANFRKQSNRFSNYGVAAFAGVTGASWLWGVATHNDHLRETGILGGEAALNTLAVTYAIKSITRRDRPLEGNGQGNFWSKGHSFPSDHAAVAWSLATVFAHEYPGPLTKLFAYGGAAAISAARVTANKHFASDALVGSALGYFIGRQVYRAHRDQALGDAAYGTFERTHAAEGPRDPRSMGSTFVALDSWVYGAMDRLAALGYIDSAFAGLRPWTRMECARLVHEAEARTEMDGDVLQYVGALSAEFAPELNESTSQVAIESLYTRFSTITDQPLNDGLHFGQTFTNDFGRPNGQGNNFYTGISARASAGPLAFYFRGEYQHSPSVSALPLGVRQTIAQLDGNPLMPALPRPSIDRFRPVEVYAAINLNKWQISLGKQSLWWGPDAAGPMMFSNNAEPIHMLRINHPSPSRLPGILGVLGPIRTEFFIGQLQGHQVMMGPTGMMASFDPPLSRQPLIHGQKFSFKPTPNLEIGFSRTTIFGGGPYAVTWGRFFNSLAATGNTLAGTENKAGDRRSGLDFSYRIPKLRNWLTFYADGFVDDEFSPVAYWDRSAWTAGLYMPRVPLLPKLDLRAEGIFTDLPIGGNVGHAYFYYNGTWKSGYTSNQMLLGSWIGRQGQGAQAWSTYHFSPRNSLQLGFRHQKSSRQLTPGGGTITDVSLRSDLWLRQDLSMSAFLQYERWAIPALADVPRRPIAASFQLTFWPRAWSR